MMYFLVLLVFNILLLVEGENWRWKSDANKVDDFYTQGVHVGTAPTCDAWPEDCVGDTPYYWFQTRAGDGGYCIPPPQLGILISNSKIYCGINPTPLKETYWRGTAPSCDGECSDCGSNFCIADNNSGVGEPCTWADGVFGLTGQKVLCGKAWDYRMSVEWTMSPSVMSSGKLQLQFDFPEANGAVYTVAIGSTSRNSYGTYVNMPEDYAQWTRYANEYCDGFNTLYSVQFSQCQQTCINLGKDSCGGILWNPDVGPTSSQSGSGSCHMVYATENIGFCTGNAAGHWDAYALNRIEIPTSMTVSATGSAMQLSNMHVTVNTKSGFRCDAAASGTVGNGNTIETTVDCSSYIGCFTDQSSRALSVNKGSSTSMTIDLCMDLCSNYKYMGVQNGNQCFCGNDGFERYGTATNCDKSCTGESLQTCGGRWANSVYQLPEEFEYTFTGISWSNADNTQSWDLEGKIVVNRETVSTLSFVKFVYPSSTAVAATCNLAGSWTESWITITSYSGCSFNFQYEGPTVGNYLSDEIILWTTKEHGVAVDRDDAWDWRLTYSGV